MVTVVNTPNNGERVIERTDTGGWAVAVIVLIAVVAVGGFFLWRHYQAPAAAPAPSNGGANINVTIPAGGDNGSDASDNAAQ